MGASVHRPALTRIGQRGSHLHVSTCFRRKNGNPTIQNPASAAVIQQNIAPKLAATSTSDRIMPLPVLPGKSAPARTSLRRSGALVIALAALLLWLLVLPALLSHDSLIPLGNGCWFRGYRDPVTGRGTAFAQRDLRQAEACLARQWGDRP
jgi:hypothetical protein